MEARLHALTRGEGPRVVLVHGFTQSHASWGQLATQLQRSYQIVQVDLPGHGASQDISVDFSSAAELLAGTGGRACYVGYSLGGRICLKLALEHPELVSALVLLGANPGIVDATAREQRRAADAQLAAELERDGLEVFLPRWLDQPLFKTLAPEQAGIEERLANSVEGLATAIRRFGTGEMVPPLWERLGELSMPVLVMAGALDLRYSAIGKEMVEAIGSAELALLDDAGHAAHLERPEPFLARLQAFLAAHCAPAQP